MSIILNCWKYRLNFIILFLSILLSLSAQVYYILSRCSYFRDECGDKDKKGIKRLLNNGTYNAAFPLHDVSLFWWTSGTVLSLEKESSVECVIIAF